MFRHVLFDLDGTLTESHEGILKSVAYALEKEGEPTDGRLDRKIVIGPPLMYTFTHTYRFPKEKARRVYGYFQERYGTIGLFENHSYDGIPALLKSLHDAGIRSYVATSKPRVHAVAICDTFGLTPYLSKIAGAEFGGEEDKAAIMEGILKGIPDRRDGGTVMVGDRRFDVIGARRCDIPVIGVGFGYGNEKEREEFTPDYYAPTVAALRDILLNKEII